MPRKRGKKRSSRPKGPLGLLFKTKGGRRLLALANGIILVLGIAWYFQQPASRQKEIRVLVSNYLDREKHIQITDLAWDLWQYYYGDQFVHSDYNSDASLIYAGMPDASKLEYPVRILKNTGSICGYSDVMKNPVWVAFRMFDPASPYIPAQRPDDFQTDQRTFVKVRSSDFTGSGYDRGHLAPNFGIARCYGPEAQVETFLMSNIIPQTHSLNAGLWKDLEMRSAVNYPARFTEVWVIAGPIFGSSKKQTPSGIPIPEACYKILIDETEGQVRVQAFVFQQEPRSGAPLNSYLVSVDEVESMTGLDFFTELENTAENALESYKATTTW